MKSMKKFNFVYLLLAFVGVIAMTSCEHPYANYTPGAKEKNQGVYFPSAMAFKVTAEDTSVEIPVSRVNAEAAAEVSVRSVEVTAGFDVETMESLFTVDRAVAFEAGASESVLTIAFDGAALEVGKKYSLSIQLDQTEATAYAISEYVFSIMIPEPWNSIGEGIYFDDHLCGVLSDPKVYQGVGTYVQFEEHADDANRIRVVNPFGPETIAAMWGGLPDWMVFTSDDTTYLEFDITDPENVQMDADYQLSDGTNTYLAYMMDINVDGYDLCIFWNTSNPIVLKDGIIKFPTTGVSLGAFQGTEYKGDFAQSNKTGYMQYYLPGVEFVNLDIYAEYAGMSVGADHAETSAIINFAYGGDVDSFKFVVVDGRVHDTSAIVEAIVAGSEDYVIYDGNVDEETYTVAVEGAGIKTLVAVPYNADGEAKGDYACVYSFYFPGLTGGEVPEADIKVLWGSVASVTGNPEYEATFPADQFVALTVIADADDIRSIKYFIQEASVIDNSDMTNAQIIDAAGEIVSADNMASLLENGNFVIGPYQFKTGQTAAVIVAFDTVYSPEPIYYRMDYTLAAAAAPSARVLKASAPKNSVLNVEKATLKPARF